jgi:hypothetical protein
VWCSGSYSPYRPKAGGMRPVACGPHGPPPALMPRRRSSPGSDARHRAPVVILGFAEYSLSFPIYLLVFLSLFFRQSLLYDSQFNISIRTRLISTGWDDGPSKTVLLPSCGSHYSIHRLIATCRVQCSRGNRACVVRDHGGVIQNCCMLNC